MGKKCQYEGESLSGDVEVAAPPSTEPNSNSTVSQLILSQLQQLGEKWILWTGGCSARKQHWDREPHRQVFHLLPPTVQAEVDKRLAELTQLNESATKGRIKSHRGVPGDVTVKSSRLATKFHTYWQS